MPSFAPATEYRSSTIKVRVTALTAQLSSQKIRRIADVTPVSVFVGLVLILFVYVSQGLSQKDELKIGCDLKRFDPVVVSHALLNAVKKQIQPIYPPAARAVNASGEVEVQIVVSRSGNVIATCAISGHPLLRDSAQKAAKQWRFKENFGYKHGQKREYILSSITFRFDSDTSNEPQRKEAKSVSRLRFRDIADEDRNIADVSPVS